MSKTEWAIETSHLSRVFRVRVRDAGVGAALRAFVSPTYQEKRAVESVSVKVPLGSCTGFVGSNGAGKTTFLKMAAGLLHPTSGEVRTLGFIPAERDPLFLKSIGMVMGQKSQLWIDIPAHESFELLATIYEIPRDIYQKRIKHLSSLFRVEKLLGTPVRKLSLGERMKMELMASILHGPKLLFLDEPTIGLDVVAKQTIRNLIRQYNKESGTTIILTSHDMADIAEVCDRLLFIAEGKIYFDGHLAEFNQRVGNRYRDLRFEFPPSEDLSDLKTKELTTHFKVELLEKTEGAVTFRVPREQIGPFIQAVFRDTMPTDMQIRTENLESLVREIMSGGA